MEDWRSKPRDGRQAFMKFVDEINERLANGETQKSIYSRLADKGFDLSYKQFNYYARRLKLVNKDKPQAEQKKRIVEESAKETSTKVQNPADLRKLRRKQIDLEELQNSTGDNNESGNS